MCRLRMKCQDTLREVASGFSLNMLLNEKCITSEDEFSFPGHFVCAWWVFPSFSYCNQGEYPLCIPVQICNDRIIVLNNGIDMNFVLFAVDSLLNTKQKLIIIHTFLLLILCFHRGKCVLENATKIPGHGKLFEHWIIVS